MEKKDPLQTSWEKPKFSTDKSVVPASVQRNDPGSLLNFYKKLIKYRNSSLPLTQGGIDYSEIKVSEVVSFKRKFEAKEELVLHNVSDVEVTVRLDGDNSKFNRVAYSSKEGYILDAGELRLPAFSTIILR